MPVILIEVVLVFGGVLAFGWWQLRSVKRDRARAARRAGTLEQAVSPSVPPASADDTAAPR